jgi:sulfur-carrier protein
MIYILSGAVGSGKTTWLKNYVSSSKFSMPVDGFLSQRVLRDGGTNGYDLFDLKDGSIRPFFRRGEKPGRQNVGAYHAVPDGLSHAEAIIGRSRPADLVIVDEVGPLDLAGEGLWPALKTVVFDPRRKFLLVIRESLLLEFLNIFAPLPVKIFSEINRESLSEAVSAMNTMKVTIKLFAYFRGLFGEKERRVTIKDTGSVRDILNELCDTPERRGEIFAGDDLKPMIVVMVNGANLPAATGLDTRLADGDVVAVFPLMGGG